MEELKKKLSNLKEKRREKRDIYRGRYIRKFVELGRERLSIRYVPSTGRIDFGIDRNPHYHEGVGEYEFTGQGAFRTINALINELERDTEISEFYFESGSEHVKKAEQKDRLYCRIAERKGYELINSEGDFRFFKRENKYIGPKRTWRKVT